MLTQAEQRRQLEELVARSFKPPMEGDTLRYLDGETAVWRNGAWTVPSVRDETVAIQQPTDTPNPTRKECRDCDGCGWVEGGPYLKNTCQTCGGAGYLIDAPGEFRSLTREDKDEIQEYLR